MRCKSLCLLLALALAVGCGANSKKTQKAAAAEQWNRSRARVMYGLANDQYKTGNFEASRRTVGDAMRLDPESAALHILSARLAIEGGQLDVAARDLEKARTLSPKDPEADYLSGVVYQRWQKNDLACQYYLQAANKNPDELAYVLAYSEMLVALDRQEEALRLLQDKVVYFENSAVVRDAVGQLLVHFKKYSEAADVLRQACVLDSSDLSIREHFALALFMGRQYRDAAESLQTLVKDQSRADRADLWFTLGQSQLEIGQLRDARRSLETCSQLDAQNPSVYLAIARVAMQQKDLDRAEMSLKRAVSLDPARSESRLLIGYLRLRQNRIPDALAAFQRASALDSGDTVSLCMVGYALQHLGRTEEAIRYYAQALKIKPGDEMAARMMASLDVNQ